LKLPGPSKKKSKTKKNAENEEGEDADADDEDEEGTVPDTPASSLAGSSTHGDSQSSGVFVTPQPHKKRNYPSSRKPRSVPPINPNDNDTGFVSSSAVNEVRNRVLSVETAAKHKEDKLKGKRVRYTSFSLTEMYLFFFTFTFDVKFRLLGNSFFLQNKYMTLIHLVTIFELETSEFFPHFLEQLFIMKL